MAKYYKIGEASEIIGVSETTLRRWDNNGKLKTQRHPINNYRVYSEEKIRDLFSIHEDKLSFKPNEFNEDNTNLYFKTENGKLFNCDCLELMNKMPSNSVDLIFADPPYNIKKAEWDYFLSEEDYIKWSLKWILEAERLLKTNGSLYICGFSENLAEIKHIASPYFYGVRWLVWFYRNKANLGNDWGRSHESILHFRKSKNSIFNIDEVRIPYNEHTTKYPKRGQATTSQYSNGKKTDYQWEPNPLGAKPKDVLEIPTISNGAWEKYSHETQKPVELLKRIILSSSNQGDLVMDPFGGSGTTYAVAEAFGRKWIGVEREIKYCEIIKERLADTQHLQKILQTNDKDKMKRREKLRYQ